jgi:hypothetical protein
VESRSSARAKDASSYAEDVCTHFHAIVLKRRNKEILMLQTESTGIVFRMKDPRTDYERVEHLQNILISHATGGVADDDQYKKFEDISLTIGPMQS